MSKYRKKPITIEATQWNTNGDHPEDGGADTEGEVVRYFRHPGVPHVEKCGKCRGFMGNHGWIDTEGGGHLVCPGDFIITGIQGERYPCKPEIFAATYDAVEPAARPAGWGHE